MNKMSIARTGTKIAVGFSTTFVVKSIIHNNVAPTSRLQQAEIWVASAVIGSMVSLRATDHADIKLTETAAAAQKTITWFKEQTAEVQ